MELAYARHLLASRPTRFVAWFPFRLNFLPRRLVGFYIDILERSWRQAGRAGRLRPVAVMGLLYLLLALSSLRALLPGRRAVPASGGIYLNLSHQHLTARRAMAGFAARMQARLIFFVHDLIPITHPEYVRPGQARLHRRRMAVVAALADAILVNSAATAEEFRRHDLSGSTRRKPPELHVLHLGVAAPAMNRVAGPAMAGESGEGAPPGAYFLVLATLEPRKNHLLLLQIWRALAASGAAAPRLIVVGRRGWENEMVLDMLERCEAIAGLVEERRGLDDGELALLLRGARALLLPSFAEGFGLPVAEALAAGTPVICSDLPALREIGGAVPEYLDPLDGPAWIAAILDYAAPFSPRRAAQCERLRGWSPPGWDDHFQRFAAIAAALVPAAEG